MSRARRPQARFEELDASKIEATLARLSERIEERFPGSGLHALNQKLLDIGRRAQAQATWIQRPILTLRLANAALIALTLIGLVGTLHSFDLAFGQVRLLEFVQALEAAINDVVLIGLGIFFLVSLERRLKRHRALGAVHELRALAHIIDMHQLTKDPSRVLWELHGVLPPKNKLTPLELSRYLDYCSEMLSLVGKIAVLYVQKFNDPVALAAVNEVEALASGLSRKIWQKLMVIQASPAFVSRGGRLDS